jgi:ammonia channel protein AmtB
MYASNGTSIKINNWVLMTFHASFACLLEHIMHGLVYIRVYLIIVFVFIMICLLITVTFVECVKAVGKNKTK